MIEAQALYINALIAKILTAKSQNGGLAIIPKPHVVQQYNDEIQARLSKSAFADPNCNSWYKNEAGLITNNWSEAVIPYQKRTSSISWDDFEITGKGADAEIGGQTSWRRVVEETQVSDRVLLAGLVTAAAGAVVAGVFRRRSLNTVLR